MPLHLPPRQRAGRAFTLLEILIVALLIGILSSIALISVRTFMDRARLRAVIGETYQIATALSLARDDIGFYPKLNFLLVGANQLGLTVGQVDATNPLNPDFEYFGNDVDDLTSRVIPRGVISGDNGWQGPYMGMSDNREGAGGPTIVTMRLPESGLDVTYPGDSWFTPYALYMMSIDENGVFSFNTGETGTEPFTSVGNFFNAVVSYGPNRVPGSGDTTPAGINARLFTEIDVRNRLYGALRTAEFNTLDRLNGYLAVIDPDSDDLVKQF